MLINLVLSCLAGACFASSGQTLPQPMPDACYDLGGGLCQQPPKVEMQNFQMKLKTEQVTLRKQ